LVPNHPVARVISDNGLCDVFEDDSLRFLRDLGVSVVETRAVWAMMEPAKRVWDTSGIEKAFEACDRHGMKLGLFVWPQHLPAWRLANSSTARLQCLEHGEDARFLSFWEPETPEILGSFYHRLADTFGDRPAVVYVGSAGCFGEPQYPQGVSHYHYFANTHNHIGFWCGDLTARRDFARRMLDRYGSLDAMNKAWGTSMGGIKDITLPVPRTNPVAWVDFAQWYSSSLTNFVDQVCGHAAEAFPKTTRMMPVGTRGEPLIVGQDKWQIARVAAKHGMTCRWTGCGDYNEFVKTNMDARRLSSACRLLGCDFATESACYISAENGMNCIYEQIANGAVIVHDDPGNYRRNETVFRANKELFSGANPVTRVAVFYSKLDNYFVEGSWDKHLFDRCVELRKMCDFEILDEDMVLAGALSRVDLLINFGGTVREKSVVDAVRSWTATGGVLLEEKASTPSDLGFQTLATAVGETPTKNFSGALLSCLGRIEAIPGVAWSDIHADVAAVYATSIDGELWLYNAGQAPATVTIHGRSQSVPAQQILLFDLRKKTADVSG
jgi:hypothetical protein